MGNINELENVGRRKAVKKIVGGVTALAAYNALPSKWGPPIIESVFLPAHAATSGEAAETPNPTPSNRYFVDDTNVDGLYHLLIVDPAGNTGNIIHVNNRRWVRREGTISFTVGGRAELGVTEVGGERCGIRPPRSGNHEIEITDIQPTSVVYLFRHSNGTQHPSAWSFTEVSSMPTVPGLEPCTSLP